MSEADDSLDMGATVRGFSPGQKVFNRYTLKKILGRGGMGVVWLAADEELEQEVALKFLPEIVMSDRSALDDLRRETRRSREMTHPHIVRIHDFLREPRTAAISMEFVAGDTLANRKAEQPQKVFTIAELRPWLEQMCGALHYAHTRAQVVHRDLKPANLMVDARGDIKITDFGIARSISDSVSRVSAQANSSSGTPVYMSPQQMMGDMPSASDDVYAFGATVYELLTSRPPFFSGNVLIQLREKIPPTLAARRAELGVNGETIPEAWEKAIASCLAKEPAGRPESMLKVAEALGLSAGIGYSTTASPVETPPPLVAAAPAPAAPPAAPRAPRKPVPRSLILGGVGAVALVVLLVFGNGWWKSYQAGQAAARAQAAVTARDWPGAFAAARAAVTLRPEDAAHRALYESAQQDWLKYLRAAGTGDEAFGLFAQTPADIAVNLSESAAADYARLREDVQNAYRQRLRAAGAEAEALAQQGNFAGADAKLARLRTFGVLDAAELAASEGGVKAIQARAGIRAALELAAGGDTAGATARLDALAKTGAIPDELAAARRQVQTVAEVTVVDQLARAVLAGDATTTQAALNAYAKVTGQPVTITAAQLLGERDFDKFLRLLEQLRMRSAAGTARTNHFDLVIVEALRPRFQPAEAAARFLNQAYAEWARAELGQQRLGSALLLTQRALAAGGTPADSMLERQVTDALVRKLDLTLALPLTELPPGLPGELQTAARDALRNKLGPVVEPFMTLGSIPDSKKPATLVVRTRLSALERTADVKTEKKSVTYQSGTKEVPNPKRAELEAAVAKARQDASGKKVAGALVGGLLGGILSGGKSAQERLVAAGTGAAALAGSAGTDKTVQQLEAELNKTPARIAEPVMSQQPYDQLTHQLTYTASLTTELLGGGRTFGQPIVAPAGFTQQVTEVKGDARRGVPVQPFREPDTSALATALGASLVKQLDESGGGLVQAVGDASLVTLEQQLTAAKAAHLSADLRWGLLQLWKKSGVTLKDPVNTERALRLELGLPL